jgi:hypothetical protein
MTVAYYHLTLIEPDGRAIGCAQCPLLPRFIHVHDEAVTADGQLLWEASDDPEPAETETVHHVDSYARIGSSVWVDDERDALYARVVS